MTEKKYVERELIISILLPVIFFYFIVIPINMLTKAPFGSMC
jgi:hypothetical protein